MNAGLLAVILLSLSSKCVFIITRHWCIAHRRGWWVWAGPGQAEPAPGSRGTLGTEVTRTGMGCGTLCLSGAPGMSPGTSGPYLLVPGPGLKGVSRHRCSRHTWLSCRRPWKGGGTSGRLDRSWRGGSKHSLQWSHG